MINNSGFPDWAAVEAHRMCYPVGCRVELVSMEDPFTTLKPGDQGTVDHVDDSGTVHISWDCGSGLGAVYGIDKIRKI